MLEMGSSLWATAPLYWFVAVLQWGRIHLCEVITVTSHNTVHLLSPALPISIHTLWWFPCYFNVFFGKMINFGLRAHRHWLVSPQTAHPEVFYSLRNIKLLTLGHMTSIHSKISVMLHSNTSLSYLLSLKHLPLSTVFMIIGLNESQLLLNHLNQSRARELTWLFSSGCAYTVPDITPGRKRKIKQHMDNTSNIPRICWEY